MLTNGHGHGVPRRGGVSCIDWTTTTVASTDYATNEKLRSKVSFTSHATASMKNLEQSRPLLRSGYPDRELALGHRNHGQPAGLGPKRCYRYSLVDLLGSGHGESLLTILVGSV